MFLFCDAEIHLSIARQWLHESGRLWSTTNAALLLQLRAFKAFYDLLINQTSGLQFPLVSSQQFHWGYNYERWVECHEYFKIPTRTSSVESAINERRRLKVFTRKIIVETPDAVRTLQPRSGFCIYDDLLLLAGGQQPLVVTNDCRLLVGYA